MKRLQLTGFNAHRRAGTAVAVVLREVEDAATFGYLHVQRQAFFKTMLPIDLEAQKPDVELPGFGFVKDPENGCCLAKTHEKLL